MFASSTSNNCHRVDLCKKLQNCYHYIMFFKGVTVHVAQILIFIFTRGKLIRFDSLNANISIVSFVLADVNILMFMCTVKIVYRLICHGYM